MAVRIRLRRMGRKKKPHYRVVVTDQASPRDGRFVESLGYYKPLSNPARLVIDLERVDYWLGQGATPSGTLKSLIAKARKGGDEIVAVGEVDQDAAKSEKAAALAAKRRLESEGAKQVEAEPEPETPEAEAEEAAAEEPAEEAEPEAEEPEAAADEPEAEAEEPAAEATEEPEAEAEEEPAAAEEAEPEAEAEDAEADESDEEPKDA